MAFEARVNRPAVLLVPLGLWLGAMGGIAFALGSFLIDCSGFFIGWVSLVSIALGMAPFSVGTAKLTYAFLARRGFLAERVALSRLPVSYTDESWFELGAALYANDPAESRGCLAPALAHATPPPAAAHETKRL